jgi:hypothetical protein
MWRLGLCPTCVKGVTTTVEATLAEATADVDAFSVTCAGTTPNSPRLGKTRLDSVAPQAVTPKSIAHVHQP